MIPTVPPTRVDGVNVYISCPYCHKTHIHGSNGGIGYGGHRAAHCTKPFPGSESGYIIEEVPGGQDE